MFKGVYEQMQDPIKQVYGEGLASLTLQEHIADHAANCKDELKYLVPRELTLVEKMEQRRSIVDSLPLNVSENESGMCFQFLNHQILLVVFCLVQFRNSKVSNNALFLIQASKVVKTAMCRKFMAGLSQLNSVLRENYRSQPEPINEVRRIDDGQHASNAIIDKPELVQIAQRWIEDEIPITSQFTKTILQSANLEAL